MSARRLRPLLRQLREQAWWRLAPVIRPLNQIFAKRYRVSRNLIWIRLARVVNGIQLSTRELQLIVDEILTWRGGAAFLVFGLGFDSVFWQCINQGGDTVFLEDQEEWIARVTAAAPQLTVYKVRYSTSVRQWRAALADPSRLMLELPNVLLQRQWNVLLVDGPAGWRDEDPGRTQSIYTALQLAGNHADVFVHDAQRIVEKTSLERLAGSKSQIMSGSRLAHVSWA